MGRAVSGFEGHVKRSTLNSAVDPEFPDRVVTGGGQDLRNKHCVGTGFRNLPIQTIRTKFIKNIII